MVTTDKPAILVAQVLPERLDLKVLQALQAPQARLGLDRSVIAFQNAGTAMCG
jgi:hypothetical protein